MQRISKLTRWTNLVIILLTFLSYLAPYINPTYFWPLTFFGIAYPWLLLANFLFIFFWLFRKDYYVFFSLACILMGGNHLIGFVGWHSPEISLQAEDIHLLTYNIRRGEELGKQLANKTIENPELKALLSGRAPNTFICFQECTRVQAGDMADLGFEHYHRIRGSGSVIFSQTPFLDKGGMRYEKTSNSYLWADVQISGTTVRIFNVHLQSNYVSGVTDKVIQEGDLQEKETWRDIRTVIKRIKRATDARTEQALDLAEKIASSPHPVLLCGDFNDTPQSFTYKTLSAGLQDTFKEKGRGFGTTYAGLIPALRIDYVLADSQFRILANSIPRVPFSDHYPVISHLEFVASPQ